MNPAPAPRHPWLNQVWPPTLSVAFAANLFLITHIGFHPHGIRGYIELVLFWALDISFFVFAIRAARGFLAEQRPSRHGIPPA